MTRWRTGFAPSFGWSLRERREADLFLADLLGQRSWPAADAEQDDPSPVQVCGVFGPKAVWRTLAQVRATVVARCNAEWAAWHMAGASRAECEAALFGRLVGYYLAANGSMLPDTLRAIQTNALGSTVNYAPLLTAANAATITAALPPIRTALIAGAPGATGGVGGMVDGALRSARQGHDNIGSMRAWSAVFVSACVRGAAIDEGLEAVVPPGRTHFGRDQLLLGAPTHAAYTIEARARRAAGRLGTYWAFGPTERAPKLGDIIVQDRRDDIPLSQVTTLPGLAGGLISHGDIVVEVQPTFVVTIGGNVGDSVRKRRYPLDAAGNLVVDPAQLFTQESDTGTLPAVPATSCHPLSDRSVARIFALLKLVEACRAVRMPPRGQALA